MSVSILAEDARVRPDLFHWNGRITLEALEAWLISNEWLGTCPSDLLDFWRETGGGDIFETETILGPLSDPHLGDNIASVNYEIRSQGMPERFVVFHVGVLIGAVDTTRGDYVALDPSNFRVLRRFSSFDEWYIVTLREEYRDRYGLP